MSEIKTIVVNVELLTNVSDEEEKINTKRRADVQDLYEKYRRQCQNIKEAVIFILKKANPKETFLTAKKI